MKIHGKPGDKVRFLGVNGYDGDLLYANKYMSEGTILTIAYINVGNWASLVSFVELPGKEFNTVMFEDI